MKIMPGKVILETTLKELVIITKCLGMTCEEERSKEDISYNDFQPVYMNLIHYTKGDTDE